MTRKCKMMFKPKDKEKHLSLVGSMLLNKNNDSKIDNVI